ncbi:hypothetical protein A4D02_24795 [Niastella koreensis]|uniref:Hep_Hag repeat-containing protein n=2 Tax=Niastella koreensis TaxID=354356 RepID=G8TFV4_NIAKG|nr:tail fiber domain-containing protein [Niastella koreensis]AEW00553.1 Hep_Hag repeat-containing protein [Niastella koreensis GR20-10]OQP52409.1 hypothetical protein A4D02_24795 [Niastella koreensis]
MKTTILYMYLKTIKALLFFALCLLFMYTATAQGVAVNTDGSVPDATALLDVKSSTKGLLIPRMTSIQRTGIATPATGLIVFDTDTNNFWYFNGTAWMKLETAGNNWSVTGNSATNTATNFIGTTDDVPLLLKVNNRVAGYIISTTATATNNITSWGYLALDQNTTGKKNVAVGNQSLTANTTGLNNTALGYQSLMASTTTNSSTALGCQALAKNNGDGNTAVGAQALFANTLGFNNVAIGFGAMPSSTGSTSCTALGSNTLSALTIGSYNTAVGSGANVSAGTISNATAIGYGAIVNASDKVRIGNSGVSVIEGQVPFTTPSDGRFKYNIKEDVKGLDFILQLRPVTYQFDVQRFDAAFNGNNTTYPVSNILQASYNEAAAIRRTGFIAQEVEQAAIKTGFDFSGINKPKTAADHYGLSYESFVVPLVKAVQEQNKQLEELKKANSLMEASAKEMAKIISLQQQALEELKKRVEKLEKF